MTSLVQRAFCQDCNGPLGSETPARARAKRCWECHEAKVRREANERRQKIAELFAAGKTYGEIAPLVGMTQASVGSAVSYMRKQGWDLPYRKRGGWAGPRPTRHEGRPKDVVARETVRRAVRVGEIQKPAACPRCGSSRYIQAHHEDYDRPLDVEWLCSRCHHDRHVELKEAA